MFAYCIIVAWRIYAAFTREERAENWLEPLMMAMAKIFVYVVTLCVAVFLGQLFPRFGLTAAFVKAQDLRGVFFFDLPHKTMGFAVLYFGILAAIDYRLAKDSTGQ